MSTYWSNPKERKERWKEFLKYVDENNQHYDPRMISTDVVDFPCGNMPSHESLSIEYNLAATAWALNDAISNRFHAEFFVCHMKRLKQLSVLAHDKPIDVETYGQVDKAEIEEMIKEMRWHRKINADNLPDEDGLPAPATQPPKPVTATATSTSTKKTKPRNAEKRQTNKIRNCPLCGKQQSQLPRHLKIHVRKGEIAESKIAFLVDLADKGEATHQSNTWVSKKRKLVKSKRKYRVCPLCEMVTCYLDSHLHHKHKIPRNSEENVRMKSLTREYQGTEEEMKFIKKTRPAKKSRLGVGFQSSQILVKDPLEPETSSTSSYEPSKKDLSHESSSSSCDDIVPPTPTPSPHSRRQRAEEAAEAAYAPKRCASHPSDSMEEEGEEDRDLAEEDSEEEGDDQAADSDEHEQQEEHSADDENQEDNTDEEDDEEDDLDSYQVNLSELLSMENPKTPRQQWLVGYYHYLQSLSGKALSHRHSEQHVRQVYLMLTAIDPRGVDIIAITDSQGSRVWQWAKPLLEEKKKRPGTIISYLTSLEKFFKFAEDVQHDRNPLYYLEKQIIESIKRVISNISAWRSVVRKQYKTDEWRRQLREMRERVRPDDIVDLDETEPAKNAKDLLEKAPYKQLTPSDYCVVRDYLIASLEMQNGQRPGPLETIIMEDYNNTEVDPVSGTTTIYAPDHKTSTSGPAPISMSKALSKKMATYVQHVRTIFNNPDDALFLTESGRQFEKGTIGRRIPEFWAKAKVRSDIRITATRMRKMAATTTVNNTDQDKRLVHQHMTHTEKTAERSYIRPDAATIAAAGHAVLKSNIGYRESDDSDVESTNKTLSEEDRTLLEELFSLEINSNKPLVSKEVAKKMQESVGLLHLTKDPRKMKQVIDRLRYVQRLAATKRLKDLAKEKTDASTISKTWVDDSFQARSEGALGRTQWNTHDTETLIDYFKKFPTRPDKSQIHAHLQSTALCDILEREGLQRCYQKVKNMFRRGFND